MMSIVLTVLMAAVASGQRGGQGPDSPIASCWNGASVAKFATVKAASQNPPCGGSDIHMSLKAVVTINCNKPNTSIACDYCIRLYFEKKVGANWVPDPAGGEVWGDATIACGTTKDIDVDKDRCETSGQTRRFIVKVYDQRCGQVDDTTVPVKEVTSDPYVVQ